MKRNSGTSAPDLAAAFWAAAAHDLRQPLQSLALTTRMLALDTPTTDRVRATANLGLAIASLDGMIEALSMIGKLGAGTARSHPVRTRIADVVRGVVGECTPGAAAAGVTIEVGELSGECELDARLLAMAIRGLVVFAIKYGEGTAISIRARQLARPARDGISPGRRPEPDGIGSISILTIDYTGPQPGTAAMSQSFIELAPLGDPPRLQQAIGLGFVQRLAHLLGLEFQRTSVRAKAPAGRRQRLSLTIRAVLAN